MEPSLPLSVVYWIIGFLVSLLGGCWAIFKYFESKLNRVYERLDENKRGYYATFLSKDLYESEQRLRKEGIDERFQQVVILFNEKIESLRNEIRGLIVREQNYHRDNKGHGGQQ